MVRFSVFGGIWRTQLGRRSWIASCAVRWATLGSASSSGEISFALHLTFAADCARAERTTDKTSERGDRTRAGSIAFPPPALGLCSANTTWYDSPDAAPPRSASMRSEVETVAEDG